MFTKILRQLPELAVLGGTVIVGMLFFMLTSPKALPPSLLMIGFIILLVGIYCALRLVLRLSGVQGRLSPFHYHGLLTGGTLLPVMLVALQSIGQLDLKSTLVLIVLFALTYFYLSRLSSSE